MRIESAIENGLRRDCRAPLFCRWGYPTRKGGSTAAALLSASLFLTACASTPEPRIITKEVRIPVAIKCAADPGADPQYADTPESLKAAPDIFAKVQLILAGRAQRNARITELTAAISGCVG